MLIWHRTSHQYHKDSNLFCVSMNVIQSLAYAQRGSAKARKEVAYFAVLQRRRSVGRGKPTDKQGMQIRNTVKLIFQKWLSKVGV